MLSARDIFWLLREKAFPKFFIHEKDKKSRNRLILRVGMFLFLGILFILNKSLYYSTKGGSPKVYIGRIFYVTIISAVCIMLPVIRLKVSEKRTRLVQTGYVLIGMLAALKAGEHVFKLDWKELKLTPIIFNLMIMFALFVIIYIVSNRVKLGILGVYVLTVLFAVTNYYVNRFRGSAITAGDVYSIGTAMNVLGEYHVKITWPVYQVIFEIPVFYSLLSFLPVERTRLKGWKRLKHIIPGVIVVIFIFSVFVNSKYPLDQGIKVKTFVPMKSYKSNGQLLNFVRGFYYMKVFPPEQYSKEKVKSLIEKSGYQSDRADYDDGTKNPNIIFIMNESLMDFTWFDTSGLSEDPMKYIHSLKGKDNAIIGKLDVDVFGGRTAVTEYETLSGNSAAFFPADAVPYSLYVKDKQPSMTWNMRDVGYSGNVAFHPYKAKGYSRPSAYPYLGFKEFIALEDIKDELNDGDYLRRVVSDSSNYKQLIKIYEKTRKETDAPFYMFNVTMQNHGGYDSDFSNFKQSINVTGKVSGYKSFKRFANLVNYSDTAFKELTDYFSKVKEPTIIVMFGDHLPGLENDFYKALIGKTKGQMDSYGLFTYFRTPLIVWANYDINKNGQYDARLKNISVNYLSSVIMEIAGVPMTAYQKFLADMQKEIPSFTQHGYIDKKGAFYEIDNTGSPYYKNWISKYHMFEYNNQFDEDNRIDPFFMLKSESNAMYSGN